MGILNATPDSFFKASRKLGIDIAVKEAEKMISSGADILDIGGESSRPGADYVNAYEEIKRVIPLIKAIRNFSDIPISVDTRKSDVAKEAVSAGADIINDISGLCDDPELGEVVSRHKLPVVLMHMRGNPKNMQLNPAYNNTLEEIIEELKISIKRAESFNINKDKIIIDPGIGFGKRLNDNILIIKNIDKIKKLGYPVLIGLSRKSFIGKITKTEPIERLAGTITANIYSVLNGADILRVHDVKETADMLDVFFAIKNEVE